MPLFHFYNLAFPRDLFVIMAPLPPYLKASPKDSIQSYTIAAIKRSLSSFPSYISKRNTYHVPHLISLHRRDDDEKGDDWSPGGGAANAKSINNSGFLALFALLGAAMVVVGIWFFFWAKNGGCVFRRGDWDDYKTTVLRRKGPDGKTLSNATKSTRLGGATVLSSFAAGYSDVGSAESYADSDGHEPLRKMEAGLGSKPPKQKKKSAKHIDQDVRDYRYEKPARVGGLNRKHDGSHFDYTNTDRSDAFTENSSAAPLVTPSPRVTPKKEEKKGFLEKRREKKRLKENKKKSEEMRQVQPGPSILRESPQRNSTPRRTQPSGAYSFREGDDSPSARHAGRGTRSGDRRGDADRYSNPVSNPSAQSSYYNSYRPHAQQGHRQERSSANNSRQSSPRKNGQHSDLSSDAGTKVYRHHIPGLSHSEVGVEDSISQVGARRAKHGYRRGATGRRDSLSESD